MLVVLRAAILVILLSMMAGVWAAGELPVMRMVAAGARHSLALGMDGAVWAWGENDCGQLGVGQRISPTTTRQLNLSGITMLAAGKEFSLALSRDGTVWAWGGNDDGQLGDGSTSTRYTPVQVAGLREVTAIAAGQCFALALTRDGTVWSWGRNNQGQLGHGTTRGQESTPRRVEELHSVVKIFAGLQSAFALDAEGRVWAWGANDYGQLGLGRRVDAATVPTRVPALRGITQIAVSSHTLALATDGTLWAWGSNDSGQVGVPDEHAKVVYTPQRITTAADVLAVAAGGAHSLLLLRGGQVYAVGTNDHGQLGDGSTTDRPTWKRCEGMAHIAAFAAGHTHNLAVDAGGKVWGWGSNIASQVKPGEVGQVYLPAALPTASHLDTPPVTPVPAPSTPPVTTPPTPKPPVPPVVPRPSKEPVGAIIYPSAARSKVCRMTVKTEAERIFPFNSSVMALSPDRKTLAYVDKQGHLRLYALATGDDRALSDPNGHATYASPTFVGNDAIAYLTEDRNYAGVIEITPVDHFAPRRWTGPMPEHALPSYTTIGYIPGTDPQAPSFVLGNAESICVLAPTGMTRVVEAKPLSGVSLRNPAISPDGRTIAYERQAEANSIWTIGIDGRNMRQLTQRDSGFPAWSPDGAYLAFLTTAVAERGLLKRDIYNTNNTSRSAGFFLFGIGIMRADGTPLKSLCDGNGKPLMAPGARIVWE